MCVAMVIIYKKTLEKKGGDDVTSPHANLGTFQTQTMSQGAALFSCGLMETRRWREVRSGCVLQQRPVGTSLESLWDVLPEVHRSSPHWGWDVGSTSGTITSLLHDLNLTEAAPPSKRQCRSLSCSEELGGCRSAWRPQGSRLWTSVEKRRCHSGGSVHRSGGGALPGFPAMQRSSSFSLPARANGAEPPGFAQLSPRPSAFASPLAQPFYLSHEQIPQGASPPSSPESTPELERRIGEGGLARSRSQPCVLNDKKIGVKRRRPEDTHKQRPSLDLAKMTQKLRNFHSLSCPGITGRTLSDSAPALPSPRHHGDHFSEHEDGSVELGPRRKDEPSDQSSTHGVGDDSPATTNCKDGEPLWVGLCSMTRDMYQLGGELDIEQIERN